MSKVSENLSRLLNQLTEVSESPDRQLKKYLAGGKKVVGCFPPYTPEELADAAGLVPMGIWGSREEPYLAKAYLPAFCCPILQTGLEMGLNGTVNGLSAVLVPPVCDALRCITQNWKAGVKDILMIAVNYPQNRGRAAEEFLASEYKKVLEQLEEISGRKVTEQELQASIRKYREHNQAMMEFSQAANDHLDVITPPVRHAVMKSAWFMDKAEHTEIVRGILNELEKRAAYPWTGKKVILTGIAAEPKQLMTILEECDVAVAGDDLAHESRQYRTQIPEQGDALCSLSAQWTYRTCAMIHDTAKKRIYDLREQAKAVNADGVIACMMKFCDQEEYDLPVIQEVMGEAGIPVLSLEIDMQEGSAEQLRTRIQTFAEMI